VNKLQKFSLTFLRVALGGFFLYAGVSKILNSEWSAAGFLTNAKTFPELYAWFALPANIAWVNIANEWGLALIGVSLIIGLWVKWSSLGGIALMALYYFPSLDFPYAGEHAFIIDDHIIYIAALLTLLIFKAGRFWGLDGRLR
jgi:thiosulfate dehydrogenase [quinone] large subunit